MNKPSKFLELLDGYITNYMPCSVGASHHTVTSYKYAFRLLIEFMYSKKGIPADKITFEQLNYGNLMEFLDWIEKVRGCSVSTKNQRLSAIISFSEYAQNRNFDAASIFRSSVVKIPMKKAQKKLRAVFSVQEVSILLRLPEDNKKIGLRDKLLLSLMYASGARAQEICDLTIGNIQFNLKGATLNIKGKGGKSRRIGIPDTCARMLQKYLIHRKIELKTVRHIFSSQTHEQMTVSCIEGIFNKYVRLAKEENPLLFQENSYPPHSMRHSTASHMLEAGVPLVVIKNFLGHVSLQSTQIYAELSQNTVDKHLKEWNEKWFPHDSIENDEMREDNKIPEFLNL
ncbi:site-specific integrase [Clostridium bowmanii]|uniref:tyrosine-type recombinase/integrase n=1 Tax=Clostridium bowmanii TaxID=132925 RepID=UPI001C0C10E1|nr:tyrosine-type recombinase/integrase [Clostridium bowmanii]MBU3192330.1 site-specific integrase [Clostridium bowmanii]MCA1076528.1 site-specific integrase [Clostridium bowmanii]